MTHVKPSRSLTRTLVQRLMILAFLIALGWAGKMGIEKISVAHAAHLTQQELRKDEEAVARVKSKGLIASPTPQVLQDPELTKQVQELQKEVDSLK